MIFQDRSDFKVKFFFNDKDDTSGVELALVTEEARKKARKKYIKEVVENLVNPETKRLERITHSDVDTDALHKWGVCAGIASFWGISIKKDGVVSPVECTEENKVMLYDTQPAFKSFVDEKWIELQELSTETLGSTSEAKNS